jgi:MEKHLA domain
LNEIWQEPQIIDWTEILLASYQRLLGKELIECSGSRSPEVPAKLSAQAQLLYTAPFVVVSHGTQSDPVLNYGNQVALDLWEMDWAMFTKTPSKSTAEPVNQAARQVMISQAKHQGFIDNYRGVRISSSGRRFEIDRAIIWNLTDLQDQPCGQAATFASWQYL